MRYLLFLPIILFFCSCGDQGEKKLPETHNPTDTIAVHGDTTACVLAQIAYCTQPQAKLDQYLPGWKVVWNPLAVNGNHAIVASNGQSYVLAFRGSLLTFTEDAFNNWVSNDLNVIVQDGWPYSTDKNARVSQGAYIGWQNIEKMKDQTTGKSLWDFISENVKDENPLLITGHSLGGNLAIIYGSYLWWKFNEANHKKNNINVITFAAPAPGNSVFAKDFDAEFPNSLRFENTNDIVPKFPCSKRLISLSQLYAPGPSAASISIGYKKVTTPLSNVFTLIGTSIDLLQLKKDFTGYVHTSGDGKLITVPVSGKYATNVANSWFSEAGFQHSMSQYAKALSTPIVVVE